MLITDVWRNQPGKYFCISTKSKSGKWQDQFFSRPELKTVKDFIQDNLDKDIYWCPHGFIKRRRLKDYAEMPRLLWADLDEADPSNMTPMPSIALQSSPGRYVGLWLVDQVVDESINRRLTYHIGADHGGWDITQVLRVPDTINYKYPSHPRVKKLWDDGPTYELKEIEHILPTNGVVEPSFGDAHKVYKRYEKRLSPFVRREILNGKPKAGKRSEILWRLNKELLEAGMTMEEAFSLLWVSPWNKFKNRKNGEQQLRRELDKAVSQKLESAPVNEAPDESYKGFLTTSLDQVEEEQLEWLWYPYIARRELTILEGDPGLGKSYLAQMIGLSIVDGKRLPKVKRYRVSKGKVVYFDMENSTGTVTKRRLIDNGGQNLKHYFQEERPFRIDDEDALEVVYEALARIRPDLVVFDTLNVYIGKADTHKASETAQAMAQFVDIARRFDCGVLVLRHLTKSSKEKALYRGQGSIATTGAARVVMTVGIHPEEPETRVMAVTKNNVTKKPLALSFTIESLPDTLKYQDRSKFVWGEFLELSSDDIISAGPALRQHGEGKEKAIEFLKEILADGEVRLSVIKRAGEARGLSYRTLLRAAKEIDVVRLKNGFGAKGLATWKFR